jgi:hypothetical protein
MYYTTLDNPPLPTAFSRAMDAYIGGEFAPRRKDKAKQQPAKPAASRTAPVGSREWAACLIGEFGEQLGAVYIDLGFTYSQAAVDFATFKDSRLGLPGQRAGMASKIKFAKGAFKIGKK